MRFRKIIFVIVFILSVLNSGCSLQYVDRHGARHLWGLNHIVIREAREERSEVIAQQISSIGLSLFSLKETKGLSFGYTRNFSIQVSSPYEAGNLSFSLHDPTNYEFTDLETILKGGIK